MLQSPYRVKTGVDFRPAEPKTQSISYNRLTKLLKSGQLSERSELIIQFLYEMHYLTAFLIQTCFHHPMVRSDLRKLRNDKKNPYLSELKYLLKTGIITQLSLIHIYFH